MKPLRTESNTRIRGIQEDLPDGERVLWQGAPAWRDLAVTAFHLRQVAVYFALLLLLRVAFLLNDGAGFAAALRGTRPLLVVALLGTGLVAAIALWSAKTTIYAITTRRVVMRVGMALPIMINLPFSGIVSARLAQRRNGCGDLPLVLGNEVRMAYLHLWPYARPWHLLHPEPMMRALPQAATVAQLLANALASESGGTALLPQAEAANDATPSASPQGYGRTLAAHG